MRPPLLMSLLLASGCYPLFDTIDDACADKVPGQQGNTDETIAVFQRVNCYRRFAQMPKASVDDRVSAAAKAHARYFRVNGLPDGGSLLDEDPNLQGFTGADPIERIEAQGYEVPVAGDVGFWEGVFPYSSDFAPEDIADAWMVSHYTRQGVLQPAWLDAGFGVDGEYAVLTIIYDFPANERIGRPVLWPRDGQTEVPVGYVDYSEDGIVPPDIPVGYPISVTVGSDESDSAIGSDNPYSLRLVDSVIEGPDGDRLDHWTVTPEASPYAFPYSIAVVADDVFQPDTTYDVTLRLTWNAQAIRDYEFSFTTERSAESPAARSRPQPLSVVHRPPGGAAKVVVP